MSTKPVNTVPKIAPVVPMPERRPTTVPVSSRSVSTSLVTMGVTADSSAPGTTMVTSATSGRAAAALASPAPRTANGVTATAAPDAESSGASARRGDIVSAALPPYHAPIAITAERSPDDHRAGLERQAEVRRQQAQRHDLHHQHRRRRPEHQRPGSPRRERRRLLALSRLTHAVIMAKPP